MAQLVARLVRNEKVRGSNPLSSTLTEPRRTSGNAHSPAGFSRSPPGPCLARCSPCGPPRGDGPNRRGRQRSRGGAGRCSSSRSTRVPTTPGRSPDRPHAPATSTPPCDASRGCDGPDDLRPPHRPLHRRGMELVSRRGDEQQIIRPTLCRQGPDDGQHPIADGDPAVDGPTSSPRPRRPRGRHERPPAWAEGPPRSHAPEPRAAPTNAGRSSRRPGASRPVSDHAGRPVWTSSRSASENGRISLLGTRAFGIGAVVTGFVAMIRASTAQEKKADSDSRNRRTDDWASPRRIRATSR